MQQSRGTYQDANRNQAEENHIVDHDVKQMEDKEISFAYQPHDRQYQECNIVQRRSIQDRESAGFIQSAQTKYPYIMHYVLRSL